MCKHVKRHLSKFKTRTFLNTSAIPHILLILYVDKVVKHCTLSCRSFPKALFMVAQTSFVCGPKAEPRRKSFWKYLYTCWQGISRQALWQSLQVCAVVWDHWPICKCRWKSLHSLLAGLLSSAQPDWSIRWSASTVWCCVLFLQKLSAFSPQSVFWSVMSAHCWGVEPTVSCSFCYFPYRQETVRCFQMNWFFNYYC